MGKQKKEEIAPTHQTSNLKNGRLRFVLPGKNHTASIGLKGRCDNQGQRFSDMVSSIFDDNHSAVICIGNALRGLAAFFYDCCSQAGTWEDSRAEYGCEFIEIDDMNSGNTCDFCQVEICGNHNSTGIR